MTKKQQRAVDDLVNAARTLAAAHAARLAVIHGAVPKSEVCGYFTREPGKSILRDAVERHRAALAALEKAALAAAKALPANT